MELNGSRLATTKSGQAMVDGDVDVDGDGDGNDGGRSEGRRKGQCVVELEARCKADQEASKVQLSSNGNGEMLACQGEEMLRGHATRPHSF